MRTPEERFWAKVNKTDTCWLWTAAKICGYGTFGIGGQNVYAHRYSYELLVGPIPTRLQIDHLCRVRHCVNPAHLDPVTQRENIRRGDTGKHHREKTHCPQGHSYDEENTYRDRRGWRQCVNCRRTRQGRMVQ